MKQFVKALPENSEAMNHLRTVFPRLSEAKIKEGIFVGPQIRKLVNDEVFLECLSEVETEAWSALRDVINGFLGNNKSHHYRQLVHLLNKYKAISE